MFDQIPDEENMIRQGFDESVRDRGVFATLASGVAMVFFVAVCIAFAAFSKGWGMMDPVGARRVLAAEGYSQIRITGYRWFTCSGDEDYFHTGFTAVGPTGKWVTGTVCKGFFLKASTVRVD